jgi:hypothetical protein
MTARRQIFWRVTHPPVHIFESVYSRQAAHVGMHGEDETENVQDPAAALMLITYLNLHQLP